MEKDLPIHSFFPIAVLLLFRTEFGCFCFLLLREGVVEGEVVSELLVIIFYLHSLWLSLSWALFAVWDFPPPLYLFRPLRHHRIGTLVSDSSVNGMFSMTRCCGHGDGDGECVQWGNDDESQLLTESKPHPSYTNLFNCLI